MTDIELVLNMLALQKFITDLTTNGNKCTDKGLSPNFVKTILSAVQNSLKTAHLVGYLPEYSANKIKRLKSLINKWKVLRFRNKRKLKKPRYPQKKINIAGLFYVFTRVFVSEKCLP